MRYTKLAIVILGCLFNVPNQVLAQDLYDANSIQEIEILFSQPNWDYQMDTAKVGSEGYLLADWVKINGIQYDSVGVKYKGNSSFDSTEIKNPLHIKLDYVKNQAYQRYEDIKLSNGYGDPSCVREVLAYGILKNYMHCPKANFAKVTINGNYIGLYSSAENIDKKFLGDHFYSSGNTFFKCNPISSPGPTQKSNFKYINADSSSYEPYYELKSDTGWNDLINLCNSVTNNTSSLTNNMDMDRAIWMLAFNNGLANLDSYNGVFAQNHYIYKDNTQRHNSILWDLNMCFGAFPYAGSNNTGFGLQTVTNLQQYSPFAHSTEVAWPLINAVMNDSSWRRKYLAHMKTIIQENIVSGNYQTQANQYQSIIDNAVSTDTHKYFSYTDFQNGLTQDVIFGSYTVPGIANLMEARKNYLMALPEFTAVEPQINNITYSSSNPVFGSTVNITATILNANASSVYLGYRFDVRRKFVYLTLFDDGNHNDGAAGDNVYGNSVVMNSAQLQHYVYAENSSIGKFYPQRAEHEYLYLNAQSSLPASGDIVINEILTLNVGGELDEYNDSEDWIEIYNKSNSVINLSDVYLSDDFGDLQKWKFPNGTTIIPNGYLTVWTDDDSSQLLLHTNFTLDKDTDRLVISYNTQILDSISTTNQVQNVSFGRYPNGVGSFVNMVPTYGYENNNWVLQTTGLSKTQEFMIYPNPAQEYVQIKLSGWENIVSGITVFNALGQVQALSMMKLSEGLWQIDIGILPPGIYGIRVNGMGKTFIKE